MEVTNEDRQKRFSSAIADNQYERLKRGREALRQDFINRGLLQSQDVRVHLRDAISFRGTCQDMCPEYERHEREYQNTLDKLEKIPGTNKVDHARAVKCYHRPAAGDLPALPSDVRPPNILSLTLDYLFHIVLPQAGLDNAHAFLRDRTRSIRQDLTLQNDRGPISIDIHERIARYHILATHLQRSTKGFSAQQEVEQLRKVLQSLKEFYDDARRQGLAYPNEPEFRAYYILIFLNNANMLAQAQSFPPPILRSPPVQLALRIHALASPVVRGVPTTSFGIPTLIFHLLRLPSTPPLIACIVEVHFRWIRQQALIRLNAAEGRAPGTLYSLERLQVDLAFNNPLEAANACIDVGIEVDDALTGAILRKIPLKPPPTGDYQVQSAMVNAKITQPMLTYIDQPPSLIPTSSSTPNITGPSVSNPFQMGQSALTVVSHSIPATPSPSTSALNPNAALFTRATPSTFALASNTTTSPFTSTPTTTASPFALAPTSTASHTFNPFAQAPANSFTITSNAPTTSTPKPNAPSPFSFTSNTTTASPFARKIPLNKPSGLGSTALGASAAPPPVNTFSQSSMFTPTSKPSPSSVTIPPAIPTFSFGLTPTTSEAPAPLFAPTTTQATPPPPLPSSVPPTPVQATPSFAPPPPPAPKEPSLPSASIDALVDEMVIRRARDICQEEIEGARLEAEALDRRTRRVADRLVSQLLEPIMDQVLATELRQRSDAVENFIVRESATTLFDDLLRGYAITIAIEEVAKARWRHRQLTSAISTLRRAARLRRANRERKEREVRSHLFSMGAHIPRSARLLPLRPSPMTTAIPDLASMPSTKVDPAERKKVLWEPLPMEDLLRRRLHPTTGPIPSPEYRPDGWLWRLAIDSDRSNKLFDRWMTTKFGLPRLLKRPLLRSPRTFTCLLPGETGSAPLQVLPASPGPVHMALCQLSIYNPGTLVDLYVRTEIERVEALARNIRRDPSSVAGPIPILILYWRPVLQEADHPPEDVTERIQSAVRGRFDKMVQLLILDQRHESLNATLTEYTASMLTHSPNPYPVCTLSHILSPFLELFSSMVIHPLREVEEEEGGRVDEISTRMAVRAANHLLDAVSSLLHASLALAPAEAKRVDAEVLGPAHLPSLPEDDTLDRRYTALLHKAGGAPPIPRSRESLPSSLVWWAGEILQGRLPRSIPDAIIYDPPTSQDYLRAYAQTIETALAEAESARRALPSFAQHQAKRVRRNDSPFSPNAPYVTTIRHGSSTPSVRSSISNLGSGLSHPYADSLSQSISSAWDLLARTQRSAPSHKPSKGRSR